jgi:hypothetical protein
VPSAAITPGVTVVAVGGLGAVALGLALAGLIVLLLAWPHVRQTTLVGPWCWTMGAIAAWAMAAISGAFPAAGRLTPLGLAAVALSFCPIVALVGAKRPQQRAWNVVVLSLWCILALPAAEASFLHGGRHVEMGDARAWFLWSLILLGPINFLPTRFWLASLCVAAGQLVAFSPHLALLGSSLVGQPQWTGLALLGLAPLAARFCSGKPSAAPQRYDRLWLDFRDCFGLLWALRVQERVNAAAEQYGWDIELFWTGFRRRDGSPLTTIDPKLEPALRTTLRGLLRRFVSGRWIGERLG